MQNFFTNNYDFLYQIPKFEKKLSSNSEELLAQKIYNSGLLRVSADERCNFVIYPVLGGKNHFSFSYKELFGEKLVHKTKSIIRDYLKRDEKNDPEFHVNNKLEILRTQIKKYLEVTKTDQIRLCRLLVQAAHPVILENMLHDDIKIFISFGQNISDLLDVSKWQNARYSNGLQATESETTAIFISCGGNPFFDPEASQNENDGYRAICKLMIVAAQEIAHYADIKKNERGEFLGRFSCSLDLTRPNIKCDKYRMQGLKKLKKLEKSLYKTNIKKLHDLEKRLKIQKKFRKYSFSIFVLITKLEIEKAKFKQACNKMGIKFYDEFKDQKNLAEEFYKFIGDMKFNLAPKASDYQNENKDVETAISCAEALARIPQQELKWGSKLVKIFSPYLYKYYYNMVIRAEIIRYRKIFNKPYKSPKNSKQRRVKF